MATLNMHNFMLFLGFISFLFSFIFYYRQTDKVSLGVDYQTHVLKLCILLALTLNFGVAYYTALDNGYIRLSRAMLNTDRIFFDMGATSLGWIIYEFNNLFFITDSWWFIAQALDYIHQHPSGLVYQELFFNQHLKFQYPTTSLLFFDFIKSNTVFEWRTLFNLFNFISIVTLPFLVWFSFKLYYRENIPTYFIEKLSDLKQFSTLISFFVFTLLFYPIIIFYLPWSSTNLDCRFSCLGDFMFFASKVCNVWHFVSNLHHNKTTMGFDFHMGSFEKTMVHVFFWHHHITISCNLSNCSIRRE